MPAVGARRDPKDGKRRPARTIADARRRRRTTTLGRRPPCPASGPKPGGMLPGEALDRIRPGLHRCPAETPHPRAKSHWHRRCMDLPHAGCAEASSRRGPCDHRSGVGGAFSRGTATDRVKRSTQRYDWRERDASALRLRRGLAPDLRVGAAAALALERKTRHIAPPGSRDGHQRATKSALRSSYS